MRNDLLEMLKKNTYPGRGMVLGVSPGGAGVVLYFIMGRSANSRNRVFTEKDGGIIAEPADPDKVEDASLILYAPVRRFGDVTIVTNGDQTDTIYEALAAGGSLEQALMTRTFEPDAPHYTPRISGIVERGGGQFHYKLSIIKSGGGNPGSVQRFYFLYPQPVAGQGHFIHTYQSGDSPLPSFAGEPIAVDIPEDIDAFGEAVWNALDAQNKISLFVRRLEKGGDSRTWVFNRRRMEGREA